MAVSGVGFILSGQKKVAMAVNVMKTLAGDKSLV